MKYTLDRFEHEVRAAISATGRVPEELIELTAPKPNIPADLAFPTFRAAKAAGVPAPQFAQELAGALRFDRESLVGQVAVAGPFLNISLDRERFTSAVLAEVEQRGRLYGADDQGANQIVLVEYSSPNVAKRMHVGHIRTTIIGQALFNIFSALGYQTISDNHLGDWGKQFGVLLTGIRHEGRPAGSDEETMAALEQLYARYQGLTEKNPAIDQEARSWSLKLEQGDPQARELWEWSVQLTMSYIQPLYDQLGAHFDTVYGESFFEDKMASVIQQALDQGVAHYSHAKKGQEQDGPPDFDDAPEALQPEDTPDDSAGQSRAIAVDLPGLPSFLLQRSDGGTLYLTRDVATVVFREQKYHPAKIIYVVDARQSLHFQQVFALARALGYARDIELIHIGFGTVFDAGGRPLSTKKGNMVYLQALLDDAYERARAVVDRASSDLSEVERAEIAEAVGVGAVIYNDLYQDPKRNITLDWERMLALEGNSAPYIQYMHARCRSILRKAAEGEGETPATAAGGADSIALLTHPSEIAAIKQLGKLSGAVREAGARYAPFVIADWCYETARALSAFYRDCPVLKAEPELRAARLRLVAALAQGLKNGLGLLGIKAPDRM